MPTLTHQAASRQQVSPFSAGAWPRGRVARYATWSVVALIVFLLPCGYVNHGDGAARYCQAKALLLYHSLAIPPQIAYDKNGELIGNILQAPDGKLYSKYGVGTPLVWTIPTAAGWAANRFAGANLDTVAAFGISFLNVLIVVATAWSIIWTLSEFGQPQIVQFLAVLLYIFGTPTLAYANTAFSEPMVALALLWAVILPVTRPGVKSSVISGLLLTFCTLVKPDLAPLPACLLPLFLGKDRRRSLVAFGSAAVLGGLLLAVNNYACRGSVTKFSYGAEANMFQGPWTGLSNYFAGLNRNIFLFNPALLLAGVGAVVLWKTSPWKRVLLVCSLVWALYLPFYASWWAWDGGMCFGPRFFQSFMPLTLLSSGAGLLWLVQRTREKSRWAAFAAVALSLFVVIMIPLQVAGMSVSNEQAVLVSRFTGESEPWVHVQLLFIKLERGIGHPEVYRRSDFVALHGGEADSEMDFQNKARFQYLNHWWLLYISNRIRGTGKAVHLQSR
jgi:hypothetical protein